MVDKRPKFRQSNQRKIPKSSPNGKKLRTLQLAQKPTRPTRRNHHIGPILKKHFPQPTSILRPRPPSPNPIPRSHRHQISPKLTKAQKNFLYMPFMHSESKEIHKIALKLYQENGAKSSIEFEIKHKEIIDKFDRHPHRNEILGRKSSQEELEFLKNPNSSF